MNQEVLLQMMRATIPRDRALLEAFLYYQAEHFDEEWDSLVYQFMTNRQEFKDLFRYFTLRQMFQLLFRLVLMILLMIY